MKAVALSRRWCWAAARRCSRAGPTQIPISTNPPGAYRLRQRCGPVGQTPTVVQLDRRHPGPDPDLPARLRAGRDDAREDDQRLVLRRTSSGSTRSFRWVVDLVDGDWQTLRRHADRDRPDACRPNAAAHRRAGTSSRSRLSPWARCSRTRPRRPAAQRILAPMAAASSWNPPLVDVVRCGGPNACAGSGSRGRTRSRSRAPVG